MDDHLLGIPVDPTPRPFPQRVVHLGHAVSLEPLSLAHAPELWRAAQGAEQSWAHLRYGPFATLDELAAYVEGLAARPGGKRIVCLDIPDDYNFMDAALITRLERAVAPILRR